MPVSLVALWWKVLCISSSFWRRKGLGSPRNKGPEMGIETGLIETGLDLTRKKK